MYADSIDTIVIIPTYNEAGNIGVLIRDIFSLGLGLSALIVDDNSPDGTSREAQKLKGVYKGLHVITRDRRYGLGSAYIDGFKFAVKNGYNKVFLMDGDLSHTPSYIGEMLPLLDEYGLVIASRYVKDGDIRDWPRGRVFLSRTANIFTRVMLKVPFYDMTSGFKCARKEVLEDIDFSTIASKGYAFHIEMVYRAFLKKHKIREYPIVFRGRQDDISKMSPGIALEAFLRVVSMSIKGGSVED